VKARLFGPTGAEIASEFQVNAGRRLSADDPVVTWLNNNTFVVAWRDFGSATTGLNDIRARIFLVDGGPPVPLTGDILVNSTVFNSQQSPGITALPSGGFVVSWEDWSATTGADVSIAVRLQAFDAVGGKIGGETVVNTTITSSNVDPSIAALADGRVAVSWTDSSSSNKNIRVQIVDPRDGIVTGTPNADLLYGHAIVDDEISGFGGNDTIHGLGGNDALYGGEGDDVLLGENGDDIAFGGDGSDILNSGNGDDELYGELGNDIMIGGAGGDVHNGGAGVDRAQYTDSQVGMTVDLQTPANNTGIAIGDSYIAVENLYGSNFADNLRGNAGANTIWGGTGNDLLYGRSGNDLLIGGAGGDTLSGGAGSDRFLFAALADTIPGLPDLILDFAPGDRIDLHLIDADTATAGDQAFHLGATPGHTGDIVVSAYDAGLDRTTLSLFVNNDATVDAQIRLSGNHALIGVTDFLL
jgi:Ca2+-binding RTX toxin-like protein